MHFDHRGLIVATRDEVPTGFVHAGFGPNEAGTAMDTSMGTTHLLMLRAGHTDERLADDLLAASEHYLHSQGAKVTYAGGIKPMNSFYLGLYGGSEIPGVLQSNHLLHDTCRRRNYAEAGRVSILHCDLVQFRAPVSHKVRQLRHSTRVVEKHDPIATNWWEACVWGSQQRDCFQLVEKTTERVIASALFWDIQPLSASWGICTAGLFQLHVESDWRRKGCATYLLGEAFRLLRRRGVATIEVQTMATNDAAQDLYRGLGFVEVDYGLVFRKNGADQNGTV
ncbi:MAG: GNAT family N-acetyltransferase [Pirellulales bacterium]|nr:GNAT family N-acetyltransferase [Pirellulales bacterium]